MVDKGLAKLETEKIVLPNSDDEDDSANEATTVIWKRKDMASVDFQMIN